MHHAQPLLRARPHPGPLRRPGEAPAPHLGLRPARLEHPRRLRRRHLFTPQLPQVRLVRGARPARLGRRPAQLHGRRRALGLPARAGAAAGWQREPQHREGTIVYPFHGWEGSTSSAATRPTSRRSARPSDGPITVCLYWNEYRRPEGPPLLRARRVPRHLPRLPRPHVEGHRHRLPLQAARRAARHTSGSRPTGWAARIFYGASVGCEIGVYGDPMILESERAVLGGMERQKRLWPELHQPAVPRDVAAEVARVELGTDLVLAAPS